MADMIELTTIAENCKRCDVCDQFNVLKPAAVWCSECDQAFCTDCNKYHSSINSTKDHLTISIEEFQALDQSFVAIRSNCPHHDKNYQVFCQTHDLPLCESCVNQHSKCKSFRPPENVISNPKSPIKLQELEKRLKDVEDNASWLQSCQGEITQHVLDENKAILFKIRKFRRQINTQLNTKVSYLNTEVCNININLDKQVKTIVMLLNQEKAKACNSFRQLELLKHNATDAQMFLIMRRIAENVSRAKSFVEKIKETGHIEQITPDCDLEAALNRITREIDTIGEYQLHKLSYSFILNSQIDKRAQFGKVESVGEIQLVHRQTMYLKAKSVNGCCILPNGKIVLTDRNNMRLLCFDPTGSRLSDILTAPYLAVDVTSIDDNTVAVTSGFHEKISIVDVNNTTIKKRINVGNRCDGLTHRDGILFVCAGIQGIISVNLASKEITPILQCRLSSESYITWYDDKLFFTDEESQSVTCSKITGNVLWTFCDEQILNYPRGISVDNDGRIFLVNNDIANVLVLSAYGRQNKLLLTENKSLINPLAISVSKTKKFLLVVNIDTAFVYDVLC